MANWFDLFKTFSGSFTEPPTSIDTDVANVQGSGISAPDALAYKDNSPLMGSRFLALRDTNDLVDLSLSNIGRLSRYQEFERLRMLPEIESALNIYADETCIAGNTKIVTPFGNIEIEKLAKEKSPDEYFLVYCYDFKKKDFTLGWAYHPRLVKKAETVQVVLSNGLMITSTPEHRILLTNGTWKEASQLKVNDEIILFNRVKPLYNMKTLQEGRYPRIRTLKKGWQTERMFVAEWQAGGVPKEFLLEHMLSQGLSYEMPIREISKETNISREKLRERAKRYGLNKEEIKILNAKYPSSIKVVGVLPYKEIDVYDLSVKDHENFATTIGIMHNCQLGENNHCFEIHCANKDAQHILERLCHEDLEMDNSLWGSHRNLCLYGDEFWELIIDPMSPKDGILKVQSLPASSMYRIETIKGRLLEFQQSGTGADITALSNPDVKNSATNVIRFTPQQIIHFRLGGDRRMFYPYGESILEQAKSAAHQLRLMEDAMTTYRLTRSPSRRVFYIDVDQLPPAKAEALIARTQDQFRKKKVFNSRSASGLNASGVEERWNPMSFDEDIWIPLRSNSQTKIDTVNEGVSWDQIGDIIYFRNKLLIALGLPKSYLAQEDPALTRLNLSSQDIRFAKRIEKHQMVLAQGIRQLCNRHLELIGFPLQKDLRVKITPSSDWREISRNEVIEARFNRASAIKGAQLMSDYDILTEILKIDQDKAKEFVSRLKMQKLDDIKLAAMAQNPKFLGIVDEEPSGTEIGTEAGGPAPELSPNEESTGENISQENPQQQIPLLPEPTDDDLDKYNLHIRNYAKDADVEDVDFGELNE